MFGCDSAANVETCEARGIRQHRQYESLIVFRYDIKAIRRTSKRAGARIIALLERGRVLDEDKGTRIGSRAVLML
jgi:hypothetical protein